MIHILVLIGRHHRQKSTSQMSTHLALGSSNCCSWTKSNKLPAFLNKVLVELNHDHCFHIVYGYFYFITAELSSSERDSMSTKIFIIWPFT